MAFEPTLSIVVPNGAKIISMVAVGNTFFVATETTVYQYELTKWGWVLTPVSFMSAG